MSRMTKVALAVAGAVVAVAIAGWFASMPRPLDSQKIASVAPGNAKAGERIFWAAGCSSCHAMPKAEDKPLALGGGLQLKTAFGTFVVPNISPDPKTGIGDWSFADFANAVMRGISPKGKHYYPAFPYPYYARMTLSDVADLYAYIKTLPPVQHQPPESDVSFPFNIRRGIGLWKLAFMHPQPVVELPDDAGPLLLRGRYLVEGPGHCGACHTPRNKAGATDYSRWLAGAPGLEGEGEVPNITPGNKTLADWSVSDIAYYLKSGFTPSFDAVGGAMVEVQENMAKLTDKDRKAIATYLKAVPAQTHKDAT